MGVMEVVRAVDCNFCVLDIFMTANRSIRWESGYADLFSNDVMVELPRVPIGSYNIRTSARINSSRNGFSEASIGRPAEKT